MFFIKKLSINFNESRSWPWSICGYLLWFFVDSINLRLCRRRLVNNICVIYFLILSLHLLCQLLSEDVQFHQEEGLLQSLQLLHKQ